MSSLPQWISTLQLHDRPRRRYLYMWTPPAFRDRSASAPAAPADPPPASLHVHPVPAPASPGHPGYRSSSLPSLPQPPPGGAAPSSQGTGGPDRPASGPLPSASVLITFAGSMAAAKPPSPGLAGLAPASPPYRGSPRLPGAPSLSDPRLYSLVSDPQGAAAANEALFYGRRASASVAGGDPGPDHGFPGACNPWEGSGGGLAPLCLPPPAAAASGSSARAPDQPAAPPAARAPAGQSAGPPAGPSGAGPTQRSSSLSVPSPVYHTARPRSFSTVTPSASAGPGLNGQGPDPGGCALQ
eukprot:tig00021179_g19281.t1